MNRIIKFRALDKFYDKMIDLGELEDIYLGSRAGEDYDFANYEVMQFTGLLDKNGKDVYEGDIIKIVGERRRYEGRGNISFDEVWSEPEPHEEIVEVKDIRYFPETYSEDTIEVIGNIYKNPELLTQ